MTCFCFWQDVWNNLGSFKPFILRSLPQLVHKIKSRGTFFCFVSVEQTAKSYQTITTAGVSWHPAISINMCQIRWPLQLTSIADESVGCQKWREHADRDVFKCLVVVHDSKILIKLSQRRGKKRRIFTFRKLQSENLDFFFLQTDVLIIKIVADWFKSYQSISCCSSNWMCVMVQYLTDMSDLKYFKMPL